MQKNILYKIFLQVTEPNRRKPQVLQHGTECGLARRN
jgi:hypothetical protein